MSSSDNRESDIILFNRLKLIDNLVVGFSPLSEINKNSDNYMDKFQKKFQIKINDKRTTIYPSIYNSISKFPQEYFNAVKYTGSVNVNQDYDGYLRRADSVVRVGNINYPSLALRMYLLLNNADRITLNNTNVTVDDTNLVIPSASLSVGMQNFTRYYKRYPNSEYTHKNILPLIF